MNVYYIMNDQINAQEFEENTPMEQIEINLPMMQEYWSFDLDEIQDVMLEEV